MANGQGDDWHLVPIVTERGFEHLPAIPCEYGGSIRVYESSAASGPHVWVAAESPADPDNPAGPKAEVQIHLTADNARRLAEQLLALADGD